jgi:hypothetical protein
MFLSADAFGSSGEKWKVEDEEDLRQRLVRCRKKARPYLQTAIILRSVAFKTSLSLSFAIVPVIVTWWLLA